ncbi:replication initiator protein A [Lachnospiraceae bacterium Oil+RF-744-WCA-WT-11]|uniref:Replication initiator protein A n=2 Tax=Porcincola intestinalis TaxID=2606632 RepID=A0A6L5X3G0_9FIRM|nr:DUF6017 domain-containing protein [Porcincola intestinalis]MSS14057.1 replication initiator protein A [Porcincola intestinalis]
MKFNYYYGSEADLFSFIRIPKIMLIDKVFQTLSMAAKVLYGVLLDRMSLSMKNGWLDEENRVYIIYQIGEIQEDLGFTKKKAMDLLAELEEFGLLEKKRRGHGLPNILYVKSFMSEKETRGSETGTSEAEQEGDRSPEDSTSEPETFDSIGSRSAEISTQEVPKSALLEVPESAPLRSKTNMNNTYRSKTESNPIVSTGEEMPARQDATRSEEKRYTDTPAVRAKIYEQIIRENICYDDLLISHAEDRELIDGITDLILETVVGTRDEILIASSRYPAEVVRSRFLKLNYSHIEYVLHCLRQNTTKVKNIRKYLLATLFNAPSTMDGYYQAEVNHDMPQYALAR